MDRRRFLRGAALGAACLAPVAIAAAAPALNVIETPALPATPPHAEPISQELLAEAEKLMARHHALRAARERLKEAKLAVRKWEARNPEPTSRACDRDWLDRKMQVKRQAGLVRLDKAYIEVFNDFNNAAITLAFFTECRSMAEIRFKAALAVAADTEEGIVARSVAQDLTKLSA